MIAGAAGRKACQLCVVGLVVMLLVVALPAKTAAAHPLGNFTINRYARLELYENVVVIHYVLDFAEIPTFQMAEQIDADGDGALSQAELDAFLPEFADGLAKNIVLTVDGIPQALDMLDRTAGARTGQASLDVLRVAVVLRAQVEGAQESSLRFSDTNYADRPGWREMVVQPSAGSQITVDPRLLVDRSDALRDYSGVATSGAPTDSSVAFTWAPASGTAVPAVFKAEHGAERTGNGGLGRLLNNDRSLGIILLSLLAAVGFGALHALGPGHGKSVVAAYLVGSRGTPRHALALGLTVTATHTAAVYALGFFTIAASDLLAPEEAFVYLGVGSGLLIVVMGASLFLARLRSLRAHSHDDDGLHRHGLFGKRHSHMPGSAPAIPHVHDESEGGHDHSPHAMPSKAPGVTWRSLFALGVAGGLLPCPSALVVMLAAISLGQVFFGMLLIVAFSAGLAGVLVAIGFAVVLGKRLSNRPGLSHLAGKPVFGHIVTALPIVSAFAVTLAGVLITVQSLNQPGL